MISERGIRRLLYVNLLQRPLVEGHGFFMRLALRDIQGPFDFTFVQEWVEARRVEGRHIFFFPRLLLPLEDRFGRLRGRRDGLRLYKRRLAAPAAPGVMIQTARGAVGPLPEVLDGSRRLRWTDGRFWGRRPRGRSRPAATTQSTQHASTTQQSPTALRPAPPFRLRS